MDRPIKALRAVCVMALPVVLGVSGCAAGIARPAAVSASALLNTSRAEVEAQLGSPGATRLGPSGRRLSVYLLPQQHPGSAAAHALISAVTLGLWEVFAGPTKPADVLTVAYGTDERVLVAWWDSIPVRDALARVRRPLTRALFQRIEQGACPLLSPCLEMYSAEVREWATTVGYAMTSADELALRMAQQIAHDADIGDLPRFQAVNQLLALDAMVEGEVPSR